MAALIRGGALCRSCSGTKCRNESTPDDPIDIECPSCFGHGCDKCNEGFTRIDGCPNRYCSQVGTALDIIDMINKGHLPVAGGTLDQAASIINATHWFNAEESRVRNEQFS